MASKRIYVLASHEPNLDPRIDWVARYAADVFDVAVFGLADHTRPALASDSRNGYRIQRLTRSWRHGASLGWAICGCFGREPFFWLALLRCVLFTPIFVFAWCLNKAAARMPAFARTKMWPPVRALARPVWMARHFLVSSITLFCGIKNRVRPDLLYCNDLDTLLVGILLKHKFGCRLIYDAHEYWAHIDPASPRWEVRFFQWYERTLLSFVDAAFTVNTLLAQKMATDLGRPYLSLPNCEPVSHARVRKPDANRTSMENAVDGKASERVRFLFQGQFAPERGIIELIQVWTQVSPEKAALFLRGPDNEDKAACIALAEQLGILNKSVYFLEPILETELVDAAASFDVGVIPYKPATVNYRYCCPNKLSQYMQAGLAILANHLDFVKATVEQYDCGLTYHSDNLDGALLAINRLIEDAAFRKTCQTHARLAVVKDFNWQVQSQELYRICAQLAELPPTATLAPPLTSVA